MTAAEWLPAALNRGWIYRDRIGPAAEGLTVSAYYAGRYRHSEAATWRQRLEAGEIRRNGVVLLADERLANGDRLAWQRPPWWEEAVPQPGPALFDDGDLCVLDKPSGLPVLPAGGWLEHTALKLLERRHQGDPAGIPRPVHRLGRYTSGLLVCARRPATRAWLSAALRESTAAAEPEWAGAGMTGELYAGSAWESVEDGSLGQEEVSGVALSGDGSAGRAPAHGSEPGDPRGRLDARVSGASVRKLYRALLVPAALALESGQSLEITTPIGRRPHPRLGLIWCAGAVGSAGDLPSRSTLTLLERRPEADLVGVAIGSGRPHQIRIHCAAIGAPLLGDPLYRPGGGADPEALPGEGGYQLQAWRLALRRPDGSRLALEAPRPLGAEGWRS